MKRIPDQSDLFRSPAIPRETERAAPYQAESATSKAAAREVSSRSAAMRDNVLAAIVSCGTDGATRKDLESITGYLTQTLCARLNELEHMGRIRKMQNIIGGPDNQRVEVVRRDGCSVYRVAA